MEEEWSGASLTHPLGGSSLLGAPPYPPKQPVGESSSHKCRLSNIREKERKKKEEAEPKEKKRIERAQKKITVGRDRERKRLERQL